MAGGTVTNVLNNNNAVFNNYDFRKLFVFGNRFNKLTFLNNTGASAAFTAGLVLALKSDTNQVVPFNPSNGSVTDGTRIPFAILAQDLPELANNATQANVNYCIEGDVAEERITTNGSETLASVVAQNNNKTVRQTLLEVGINPVSGTDLTGFDNS